MCKDVYDPKRLKSAVGQYFLKEGFSATESYAVYL